MTITIVTLNRGGELFVGAIEGRLTTDQQKAMADGFELKIADSVSFSVAQTAPNPESFVDAYSASLSGYLEATAVPGEYGSRHRFSLLKR